MPHRLCPASNPTGRARCLLVRGEVAFHGCRVLGLLATRTPCPRSPFPSVVTIRLRSRSERAGDVKRQGLEFFEISRPICGLKVRGERRASFRREQDRHGVRMRWWLG